MHPQDFLTMKEAIGLFDIAKSAISAMAEEIAPLRKKEEAEEMEQQQQAMVAAAVSGASKP
jgi:hypothetical protein